MTAKELRGLDVWIAEYVMGYRLRESNGRMEVELPTDEGSKWCGLNLIQNYSTDPAAAMEVLKRIIQISKKTVCQGVCTEGFQVYHGGAYYIKTVVTAETLELAIALFSKKLFA